LTVRVEAAEGVLSQRIADNATGTAKALVAVKDATQAGFDAVQEDINAASQCAQKHNARISALEGAKDQIARILDPKFLQPAPTAPATPGRGGAAR